MQFIDTFIDLQEKNSELKEVCSLKINNCRPDQRDISYKSIILYTLMIQNYFSKWFEVYTISNHEARTIAQSVVDNWVSRFGTATVEMHSNQGQKFESIIFTEICNFFNITKTRKRLSIHNLMV